MGAGNGAVIGVTAGLAAVAVVGATVGMVDGASVGLFDGEGVGKPKAYVGDADGKAVGD